MYGSSSWQLPIFKSATATMWRLERVRRVCCLLSIGVHTQSTHQSKTNLRNKMFDSSALNASFRSAVQCVCTHQPPNLTPHQFQSLPNFFLPASACRCIFFSPLTEFTFFPRHKFCLRKNIEWRKKEKKNCAVIRHFDDDENRKIRKNVWKKCAIQRTVCTRCIYTSEFGQPDQQIIVISYSIWQCYYWHNLWTVFLCLSFWGWAPHV